MATKLNYIQMSNQGCLIVDLMYLFGLTPTLDIEKQILTEGLFKFRDSYTFGILLTFLDSYEEKQITIYFDNSYFLDEMRKVVDHPRLKMVYAANDTALLDSLAFPFIVYVDNNITDGYTHVPHFMMVTGVADQTYDVFDPWIGETRTFSKQKILYGIEQLRSHIKFCPFVITQ